MALSGLGTSLLGGITGHVTLKVTPEVLTSKSTEVANRVNKMKTYFNDLKTLMEKTSAYWEGEAGDKHRQMYKDLLDEVDEILRRLGEHPVDLVTIAQKYSDVELKIQEEIQSLPGDILL